MYNHDEFFCIKGHIQFDAKAILKNAGKFKCDAEVKETKTGEFF